jgi:ankyrin repeat protein
MRANPTHETYKLIRKAKTLDEVKRIFDERNEDVNGYIYRNYLFLDYIIRHHCYDVGLICLLLEYGADLNKPNPDYFNMTPFIGAVSSCSVSIIEICLSYGADASVVTTNCFRPLDYAIPKNNRQVCKILLDFGAPYPAFTTGSQETLDFCKDYYQVVQRRLAASRKSLCALLWCTKRSFIPLRGIILELAKQSWAQRGGEGCGARGHKWFIEN